MPFVERWRERARRLKSEVVALWFACNDARVPWYARLLAACVVSYALSPIDLIPDFIPVLGYLDDLIIVPLGIVLVIKMIPPPVMADCRSRAAGIVERSRAGYVGAGIVISVWLLVLAWATSFLYENSP